MENLLCPLFIVCVVCAFLSAISVPVDQRGLAFVLGLLLGPFGVLAAILISIRRAIEGERPGQPNKPAPRGKPDLVIDDNLPAEKPRPLRETELPTDHLPPLPPMPATPTLPKPPPPPVAKQDPRSRQY